MSAVDPVLGPLFGARLNRPATVPVFSTPLQDWLESHGADCQPVPCRAIRRPVGRVGGAKGSRGRKSPNRGQA